jgi:hypothetical protein
MRVANTVKDGPRCRFFALDHPNRMHLRFTHVAHDFHELIQQRCVYRVLAHCHAINSAGCYLPLNAGGFRPFPRTLVVRSSKNEKFIGMQQFCYLKERLVRTSGANHGA